MGVLITPLCIGASVYHDWLTLYGTWLCETVGLLVAALCAISIYSITLLTLDKFVYIKHPLHYPRLFTVRKARLAIALTWLVCFLYFVLHKLWSNRYYYDVKAYVCSIDFPKQWDFTLFVIATIVLPPAVTIVYCNYQTFKVSRRQTPLPSVSLCSWRASMCFISYLYIYCILYMYTQFQLLHVQ